MKFIFSLFLVVFFIGFLPCAAEATPLTGSAAHSRELSRADIERFVQTLEHEGSRKDFISHLKILTSATATDSGSGVVPAEEPAVEVLPPLAEQIGVKDTVDDAVTWYDKFLTRHKLSSSLVNQAGATTIVVVLSTLLIVVVQRLLRKGVGLVARFAQQRGLYSGRFDGYARVLRWVLRFFTASIAIYTLGKIWDIGFIDRVAESNVVATVLSSAITILLVAIVAAVVWEIIGVTIAYSLHQSDEQNQTRIQTLLPIVRNILLTIFGVLFGLVLLSEIGVNVAPLMAGAGVIGVAVGFGAQTLVKDFITGFIIVLEDNIRVGDVVTLGAFTGVVEKITLRKVQLRDLDGRVYTIPYSEITIIQNLTKDYSFYTLDIGISYNESVDRVIAVLRDLDHAMQNDPEFGSYILSSLEIFGLDKFADSSVVIKARLKTLPGKQWPVGREFNRRMKMAFDVAGIEIPFPQRTITVRHEGTPTSLTPDMLALSSD